MVVVTEKYIREHFKWTYTEKNWLMVAKKPVPRSTWWRLRQYGEPRGWEFTWDKKTGLQYFTIPLSEAEKERIKKTGCPVE